MIPAVVLAAGLSRRMARPKALMPLPGGATFLSRVVQTLLDGGVDDVVIVVGHEAEAIASAFATTGLPARFVLNEDYERGQLTSIRAGLRAIDRPGIAGMLLTLVDVPLVSPATVRAVLAHQRQRHALVVRPSSGDRHGHPVFVDRSLFAALHAADVSEGAKPVVRAHASAAGDVAVDDEGAFMDIDTPEEYERALQALGARR